MFERFTERARNVVVLAQEESRAFRHIYVGTEHLLLGLLREREGLAARVLAALDVTEQPTRARVAQLVAPGEETSPEQLPFTGAATKALELSREEARGLGHEYVGTEHILLSVSDVKDGLAARILRDCDADAARIRAELIGMLSGSA